VLCWIEEEYGVSTKTTARMEAVSHNTVMQMLQEQLLYSHYLQWVQEFTPADYLGRAASHQWLLQKCAVNPDFLSDILFTFCLPMKQDLHETALPASIILLCGQMITPMLLCS
jgi:hypothetical protein